MADRGAGGGWHRGGDPSAGAGGDRGGQPAGGAGRGGQPGQGVQGSGGDPGGVEGAEHGPAGGGADLAQRVHQAGGHPSVGRLHRRQRRRGQPGGGDAQADPGQDEPGQQYQPGGGGGQVGHGGQPGRGRGHAHAQQHPHRHLADQPTGDRGNREGDQRQRQEPQPGLDGRVAQGVLHVQR